MMTPFYWIDGFHDYDRALFKGWFDKFNAHVAPIAHEYGLNMTYLNIVDLFFGYTDQPHVYFEGEDLLEHKAYAYIPYTNPHPQTEQILHSLARIVTCAQNWKLINQPLHLDRNKEHAYHLASLVGAKTIPSWLVPEKTMGRAHLAFMEKQIGPYPYILKPTSMLAGLGVMKVESREMLCSLLDHCAQSARTYLIQPFLKGAADCRVYLENHEVIACQKRIPPEGGYLANISQSGRGEAVQVNAKMEAFSVQLAKQLTPGYLCIDWLVTDEEIYFSEIDFAGLFLGLPEPERSHVIHAFFRSVLKK
ncbi:MAG: ATP-grasp domain-containing protein [Gammaproteobacteria bacterium]|nr:hypothetical protein [Chlamydiales bacterium]MCH9690367.1 ATP-grasp domain-containing protein [Gammaproteobacteria bacterium]